MKTTVTKACLFAHMLTMSLFFSSSPAESKELKATGYIGVLEGDLEGTQTISILISGKTYRLKASFLYGGHGVAMQGTGKISTGQYIHYDGGGGPGERNKGVFVRITDEIKSRYAAIGITDFTGFGAYAVANPTAARFSQVQGVTGASGRVLKKWFSIAVSAEKPVVVLGSKGTLCFNNGTTPENSKSMPFSADDTGDGDENWVDVYLGEGKAALQTWITTGGNRTFTLNCNSAPSPPQNLQVR